MTRFLKQGVRFISHLTSNGANLKMETIKEGSSGPAATMAAAAATAGAAAAASATAAMHSGRDTTATAWKCFYKKSAAFDAFDRVEPFWPVWNRFRVVVHRFGPFWIVSERFGSFGIAKTD